MGLEKLASQPLSIREEVTHRLMREQFQSSLFHTAKYLLGYKDLTWRTHGQIVRVLEDSSKRKLLVLPRGSFKSSLACEAFPIWLLLNQPNLRILIDSEIYTNSKNFLRKVRALFESDKLVSLFGSFKSPDNWNEGELTISQRTEPFKEASITCSGVGAVKVGQHYDYIIMDDLNSQNNSNTPEGLDKVINHYRMSISLLEPNGTIVVVGTRYHTNDIIGWILENEINAKGLLR